jgi:hypothetical protein
VLSVALSSACFVGCKEGGVNWQLKIFLQAVLGFVAFLFLLVDVCWICCCCCCCFLGRQAQDAGPQDEGLQ